MGSVLFSNFLCHKDDALMKTIVSVVPNHPRGPYLPQVDITEPELGVILETDVKRKVIYVHVDGITVLRICRCPSIEVVEN
jgi:hypothetical protein